MSPSVALDSGIHAGMTAFFAPVSKLQISQLYTNIGGPSFRHGLPESSHKDVKLGVATKAFSNT